jgi:hypothetical protein
MIACSSTPTHARVCGTRNGVAAASHPDVLAPETAHYVLYDYLISDGSEVEKPMTADAVTITFIDVYGQQWRRTGHNEPIRVTESGPATRNTLR